MCVMYTIHKKMVFAFYTSILRYLLAFLTSMVATEYCTILLVC